MKHEDMVDVLWKFVRNDGTHWLTEERTSGYLVDRWSVAVPDDGDVGKLEGIGTLLCAHLASGHHYDTFRVERDHCRIYYDLGEWFADMPTALMTAIQNNELAIWDLANNCSIEV